MNLEQISDEQLKAELERREMAAKVATMPKPLAKPDYSKLEEVLSTGIIKIMQANKAPEDFKQYIFEAAMEARYGTNVWTWYNANT
ncbi:MAG: hypothetical protein WC986_14465 [Elusimicrobiota bacterium]|jgi:hypothetical protein